MKPITLKMARIGNSRGGRILDSTFIPKLSWKDTAREMAAAPEDWTDWDVTLGDGLSERVP